MKRSAVILAIACVVGLALAGCAQGANTAAPSGPGAASESTNAPSVQATASQTATSSSTATQAGAKPQGAQQGGSPATMAKFSKIKNGMTYAEVVKILGAPSKKIGESSAGSVHIAMYGWYGEDVASALTISFLNGAVNAKSQIGLK